MMETVAGKVAGVLGTAVLGLAAWLMTTVHTQAVTVGKIETEVEHIENDIADIKQMQQQMLTIMIEEK